MTDDPDPRGLTSIDHEKASVHAALFGGPKPDARRIGRFRITGCRSLKRHNSGVGGRRSFGAEVLAAAAAGCGATRTTEVASPVLAAALPPPCAPVAERMAGIWDAATRDELTARYEASPGGGPRWWAVERKLLDGWVAD